MANRTRNVSPSIIPWGSEGSTYDPIQYKDVITVRRTVGLPISLEVIQLDIRVHLMFNEL